MARTVERPLAILFCDIAGSTGLYEGEGNRQASRKVLECLEKAAAVARQHDGRVIKSLGDGLLIVFQGVELAHAAAIAMQQTNLGHAELKLRVAYHVGPVVEKQRDVFGDAVNVTARIAALAEPGEILTTGDVRALLSSSLKRALRTIDRRSVRGREAPLEICKVMASETRTMTRMTMVTERTTTTRISRGSARLVLVHAGQSLVRGRSDAALSVGRHSDCGLVVEGDGVSRFHAVIAFQRDRFTIADRSTHGTYINVGAESYKLLRESMVLVGEGEIGLGLSPRPGDGRVIGFKVEKVSG